LFVLVRSEPHPQLALNRVSLVGVGRACPPFDKDAYGDVWKEVQQLGKK